MSFGQGKGQKLVEGDNKTPKGMYFVINSFSQEVDARVATEGHPYKYDRVLACFVGVALRGHPCVEPLVQNPVSIAEGIDVQ